MNRTTMICLLVFLLTGCASSIYSQVAANTSSVPKRGEAAQQEGADNPLLNPEEATEQAPDKFRVKFETTAGNFVVECTREWSPNGVDRLYNLVKIGFFQDVAVFRAIEGFMFQFGIHGDPEVSKAWKNANINDDEQKEGVSNQKGYLSFAMAGPDTRTTQLFVNLGDNSGLDNMGFTPIGVIVSGMEVIDEVNTEYGENDRSDQMNFQMDGNSFIKEKYPNLDFITSASLVEEE